MISNILTRIFGSRNERLLKEYGAVVRQINAFEPAISAMTDEALKAKTSELKERFTKGETLDDLLPGGLRRRTRGRQAGAADAPFRRSADRRDGAAQRQDRGNAHRRRQDARRDASRLSQCAFRQRRAHRHRQRLSGAARRGLDGADLSLPRAHRRRQPVADGPCGQAGRLRRGHHLRHQQRVRVRLSARQHGVRGGAAGAARAHLRHRRRGRLDPDRRGAHAAHHLGPGRRQRRSLLPAERARRPSSAGRPTRRAPATTGSTRRRIRCCSPRRATSTPRRSSPRPGCSPRARACTTRTTSR